MESPSDLVFVFMPSLVSTLLRAEEKKGSPLTRAEVESIRDGATCVASPRAAAESVTRQRGYEDIRPEHAWKDRQTARAELIKEKE